MPGGTPAWLVTGYAEARAALADPRLRKSNPGWQPDPDSIYGALDGLGVFESLQRFVSSLTSSQGSAGVNASKWFSASRVLGYTALLGSLNIVLITAMSTIGAVVYNLTSRLVGGVEVTLRETE